MYIFRNFMPKNLLFSKNLRDLKWILFWKFANIFLLFQNVQNYFFPGQGKIIVFSFSSFLALTNLKNMFRFITKIVVADSRVEKNCVSFFGPFFTLRFSTLLQWPVAHHDQWGRCRIRTWDLFLRSLVQYQWATTSPTNKPPHHWPKSYHISTNEPPYLSYNFLSILSPASFLYLNL